MKAPPIRVLCAACGEVLFRWPSGLRPHPVCDQACLSELRRLGLVKCGGTRPIRDQGGRRWCGPCGKWHALDVRWASRHICREAASQLQRERRVVERLARGDRGRLVVAEDPSREIVVGAGDRQRVDLER